MIEFTELYDLFKRDYCISINNNSQQNIVFFGNCQIVPIAYYLNSIIQTYNIHIILSWVFQKEGFEFFDMNSVNNKINSLVKNCDILIYHKHITNYGINADVIDKIPNNAIIINIPNLQMHYIDTNLENFYASIHKLEESILESHFKEFKFLLNYKTVLFFNTNDHPTHFVLYLLTLQICYKILNIKRQITLEDYYSPLNRRFFKKIKQHIILPGKVGIKREFCEKAQILFPPDYFDI